MFLLRNYTYLLLGTMIVLAFTQNSDSEAIFVPQDTMFQCFYLKFVPR
uniref:Uncharacterized protein n=1 Tax=Anguilla anguilla TaxID=7936 RepID=A0A0E9S6Z9_ANGAN